MSDVNYITTKKKLAKRFYCRYFGLFMTSTVFFVVFLFIYIDERGEQSLRTQVSLPATCVILFFISCFLLAIIIIGYNKLNKDEFEIITGTVIDMKYYETWSEEGAPMTKFIVEFDNGKRIKIKISGHDEEETLIGQKHTFFRLFRITVSADKLIKAEF